MISQLYLLFSYGSEKSSHGITGIAAAGEGSGQAGDGADEDGDHEADLPAILVAQGPEQGRPEKQAAHVDAPDEGHLELLVADQVVVGDERAGELEVAVHDVAAVVQHELGAVVEVVLGARPRGDPGPGGELGAVVIVVGLAVVGMDPGRVDVGVFRIG